jgi:hypothetical protein
MAELKQTQVTNARQAAIANLGAGREIEVNDAALGALRTTPAQTR